jgi:hypothetical protein
MAGAAARISLTKAVNAPPARFTTRLIVRAYLAPARRRGGLASFLRFVEWPDRRSTCFGKQTKGSTPLVRRTFMARVQKSNDSSSLAEVVDRILDKGIVIDAWVKISLVGIELITIEARVVVASVETYLKYAEAVGLTASAAAPA